MKRKALSQPFAAKTSQVVDFLFKLNTAQPTHDDSFSVDEQKLVADYRSMSSELKEVGRFIFHCFKRLSRTNQAAVRRGFFRH